MPGYVHRLPSSFGVAVALNVESEDRKPGGSHGSGCEHFQAMEVDGVINEDRLGLDRVYVQAKRF